MKYILIILLFASCNATKQAAKHLDKAFKKDAVYVAKVTRDSFPCTELLRTDTAFVYTDSTVYISCPDYEVTEELLIDTSTGISKIKNNEKGNNAIPQRVQIKVPVKLPIKTVYINRYFEDSAKIKVIQKELTIVQSEAEKWKGKLKRSRTANLWFVVSIVGLIAALVLIIRSKFK